MEDLQDYINEENLIKDQIYQDLESSITCIICLNIIIEPMICMNCQNIYCKKCIQNWSKINNKCPNRCENSNYQKCIETSKLLSKLNFNCKHCNSIINYDEMEKHYLSKCELGNKLILEDIREDHLVKRKNVFQRITDSSKETDMFITSKLFFLLIYLFFSYHFGCQRSWKNFFNK